MSHPIEHMDPSRLILRGGRECHTCCKLGGGIIRGNCLGVECQRENVQVLYPNTSVLPLNFISHPDTYLRYGPAVPHQNFISIWVLSVARKIDLNVSPNHPEIFIGACTKCEIGSIGLSLRQSAFQTKQHIEKTKTDLWNAYDGPMSSTNFTQL